MKNFIFISPNFPTNYWKFCRGLKNNGMNVLGIGDQPYDELDSGLKESLAEYYKVSSLENYDEVFRAVAFFSFKYGHIDWLESNNEYWLEQDARLRTDFNIGTGFRNGDMPRVKFKSVMKKHYAMAGIPAAHWHLVEGLEDSLGFIKEVGYPVCVKPDNGVGASDTHKIKDEKDLKIFLENRIPGVTYIMEEFVFATVNSYDAIIDSSGTPIFETGNVTPLSIMDIVNDEDNALYYILKELPEDTRAAGRAAVKAFGVKSRFIHFEFFRLTRDMEGLGRTGEIIGLEVNMRPCGGFTPDMINYAHGTDVYQMWADMVAFDESRVGQYEHNFCAFVGRRDGKDFALDDAAVMEKYGGSIKMSGRMPEALSDAMGNQMFVGLFKTREELDSFYRDVLRLN